MKKITIIGSRDEMTNKCEYCGKIDELRPYGRNGARICYDCGMKPENRDTTDAAFSDLLNSNDALIIKG